MKLLVISTYGTYPELNNGPPIVIYNLIKYWSLHIDEIHLITGVRNSGKKPPIYNSIKNLQFYPIFRTWGVEITDNDYSKYVSSFKTPLGVIRLIPFLSLKIFFKILEINPDIIFYNALPIDPVAAVPFLLVYKKTPQVCRIPVYFPAEFASRSKNGMMIFLLKFFYDLMLGCMDLIITQSDDMHSKILGNINKRCNCIIIPNGTEPLAPIKREGGPNGFINILFTGNVAKEKGIETLIDSLSYLEIDTLNKLKIYIVGKGKQDYIEFLQRKIADTQFIKNIAFTGEISHEEITKYYINANIYIFPSYSEGMSLSLLEAMGSRLPIIASDIPGIRNIVKDGYSGLLFKVGDPEHLSTCLGKLIFDQELKNRLAGNAYETANKLRWEIIADCYLAEFNKILSTSTKG